MAGAPALETTPSQEPEPLQVSEPAPEVAEPESTEVATEAPETTATLPENWHEHPDIKSKLAEQYQQGQSRGDRAYRRQLQEVEAHFDERVRQVEQSATAAKVVQELGQTLADIANSPDLAQDLQRVLTRNETWAQVFSEARYTQGRGDFARDLSTKLYEGMDEESTEDLADAVTELNGKIRRGQLKDGDAFQKMLQERDKILRKAWEKESEAEIEKRVLARLEAEGRAAQRNGTPPAVAVPTGGGPAQTFEEYEHLYATGEATPDQEAQYRRMRRERGLT